MQLSYLSFDLNYESILTNGDLKVKGIVHMYEKIG